LARKELEKQQQKIKDLQKEEKLVEKNFTA